MIVPVGQAYAGAKMSGLTGRAVYGAVGKTFVKELSYDIAGDVIGSGTSSFVFDLTGNVNLSRFAGLSAGMMTSGKSSKVKGLNSADDFRSTSKLANSFSDTGGKYSAFGHMSETDGIKLRDWNYDKIREISIKNPDADSMTLGKYIRNSDGSVSSRAYTEMAKSTGDTYFDLGTRWDEIKEEYNLTDDDMFDLFNKHALDEAVAKGKTIRFSQNPEMYGECALKNEWDYLMNNYEYKKLKKIGDYWYAVK